MPSSKCAESKSWGCRTSRHHVSGHVVRLHPVSNNHGHERFVTDLIKSEFSVLWDHTKQRSLREAESHSVNSDHHPGMWGRRLGESQLTAQELAMPAQKSLHIGWDEQASGDEFSTSDSPPHRPKGCTPLFWRARMKRTILSARSFKLRHVEGGGFGGCSTCGHDC